VSGPFDTMAPEDREVLERRAVALAQGGKTEERETLGVLVVSVGDERYGLALDCVSEVVKEYRLTPVPCAPGHVRGVINLRGEIVSVIDLAVVLGLPSAESSHNAPLVVVSREGVTTAVAVGSIGDIVEVGIDEVRPPLPLLDQAHADAVAGSFMTGEGPVALLDAAVLLAPVGVES
jgi:purine-binding chemotaxis protein CheW